MSALLRHYKPLGFAWGGSGFTHFTRRTWTYSPLEHVREQNRKPRAASASSALPGDHLQRRSSPSKVTASSSVSSLTGKERPFGGTRLRPLRADAEQRREAQRFFPETLPSGRPAQHYTISQQLFYQSHAAAAAQVEEQLQRDRRLLEEERQLHRTSLRVKRDWRLFRKWSDYRDIEDPDPLRGDGKLFREAKSTSQLRTAAWQAQFEKENEDVFLPYERTSTLKKLAPNWFVRYFVQLRDRGGADHLYHLVLIGTVTMSLLLLVAYLFYTAPSRARPLKEIR